MRDRTTGSPARNIAADQGLQHDALLNQCLLKFERVDFLGEESGAKVDIAQLVEIASSISSVGTGCHIAQTACRGTACPILRFDQVQLSNQTIGSTVGGAQPGLIYVPQPLARRPLDCDASVITVEDGRLVVSAESARVNGWRVVGPILSLGNYSIIACRSVYSSAS